MRTDLSRNELPSTSPPEPGAWSTVVLLNGWNEVAESSGVKHDAARDQLAIASDVPLAHHDRTGSGWGFDEHLVDRRHLVALCPLPELPVPLTMRRSPSALAKKASLPLASTNGPLRAPAAGQGLEVVVDLL